MKSTIIVFILMLSGTALALDEKTIPEINAEYRAYFDDCRERAVPDCTKDGIEAMAAGWATGPAVHLYRTSNTTYPLYSYEKQEFGCRIPTDLMTVNLQPWSENTFVYHIRECSLIEHFPRDLSLEGIQVYQNGKIVPQGDPIDPTRKFDLTIQYKFTGVNPMTGFINLTLEHDLFLLQNYYLRLDLIPNNNGIQELSFKNVERKPDASGPLKISATGSLPAVPEMTYLNNAVSRTIPVAPQPLEQYEIFKRVSSDGEVEPDADLVDIVPSKFGCKAATRLPYAKYKKKKVKLTCVSKLDGRAVQGCRYNSFLLHTGNDGGHDHESASRPVGEITPSSGAIPINGVELIYTSPDVAGEVDLQIMVADPTGQPIRVNPTKFRVKVQQQLVPVRLPGRLEFDLDSHAAGNYAQVQVKDAIESAIDQYYFFNSEVVATWKQNMRVPRSGGISLPWGGLFDINWESGGAWLGPHCDHRGGRHMDISFKSHKGPKGAFELYALEQAFRDNGAEFKVKGEIPGAAKNHWHAEFPGGE